jgi:hypothetical protein
VINLFDIFMEQVPHIIHSSVFNNFSEENAGEVENAIATSLLMDTPQHATL